MGAFIKYVLPWVLMFLMTCSYFTETKLFMLILALGGMAIFWWIGRIYESERG